MSYKIPNPSLIQFSPLCLFTYVWPLQPTDVDKIRYTDEGFERQNAFKVKNFTHYTLSKFT